MHTHRTLMSNTVCGQWGYASPESVSLGVVPMFHITGMLYSVLGLVASGSTVHLMPRWDRELAGRLISLHGITRASLKKLLTSRPRTLHCTRARRPVPQHSKNKRAALSA